MQEKYIDGIRVIQQTINQELISTIDVDSSILNNCIDLSKKLKNVHFKFGGLYHLDDLNFLKFGLFQYINGVILSKEVNNLEPLYGLKNLKFLVLPEKPKSKFNFSFLPKLEFLGAEWSKKYSGLNDCLQINHLKISKVKNLDCTFFSKLYNLKILEMTSANIITLKGIEQLENLSKIDIDTARKLETIEGINKAHTKLKNVRFWNCPSLKNAQQLSNAVNIEVLQISKVKELENLNFLNHLKKLKICAIHPSNVKLKNNDYSPLNKMKKNY